MITRILLIALVVKLCTSQEVNDVVVDGNEIKISNLFYPEEAMAGTDITWNFSTLPNQQIIFNCYDLSTTRPTEWTPCGKGSVMKLDDGTEEQVLCGRYYNYNKLSAGPRLKVRFQTGQYSSGRFTCTVRANIKNRVETKEIHLGEKIEHVEGRADRFSELTWNLISQPGATIKLECDAMSTYKTMPCSTDKIVIEDANTVREFCGSNRLTTDIESSYVTIKLITESYPGSVRCYVGQKKKLNDERVYLDLSGPAYTDVINKHARYFNKTWMFVVKNGLRISLTCPNLRLPPARECGEDYYAVDDGHGEEINCTADSGKIIISRREFLKFRIQSGPGGGSYVHCIAQAIDGPEPDQYRNIVSVEVDSREHGKANGPRRTSCDCGRANKGPGSVARIIMGTETADNEFPWMVAIRDYSQFYYCGGSLITHWHVLTATHCLIDRDNVDLYAVLGEHDISIPDEEKSTQVIKIAKRIYASGYSNVTFENDIAIALLSVRAEYNINVGPICLTQNRIHLDNKYVLTIGWGTTHESYQSDILQKKYARVVDINVCDSMYGWRFKERGNHHKVCIFSKTRATCTGDSGGPLVWVDPETNRYTQISLVSFSYNCYHQAPSISSEIAYFYNWIESVISATYPQERTCIKV